MSTITLQTPGVQIEFTYRSDPFWGTITSLTGPRAGELLRLMFRPPPTYVREGGGSGVKETARGEFLNYFWLRVLVTEVMGESNAIEGGVPEVEEVELPEGADG